MEIVLIKSYKSCCYTSITRSKHDDKDISKTSISRLGNTFFKNVTTNDSIKHIQRHLKDVHFTFGKYVF